MRRKAPGLEELSRAYGRTPGRRWAVGSLYLLMVALGFLSYFSEALRPFLLVAIPLVGIAGRKLLLERWAIKDQGSGR